MSTQRTMQIPIQSGDENIFHNKNSLNIEENVWVRITGKAQIRFCGSHSAKSWRGRILQSFPLTSPKASTNVTESITATTSLNIVSKNIGRACMNPQNLN
jgi:hypothetical protein